MKWPFHPPNDLFTPQKGSKFGWPTSPWFQGDRSVGEIICPDLMGNLWVLEKQIDWTNEQDRYRFMLKKKCFFFWIQTPQWHGVSCCRDPEVEELQVGVRLMKLRCEEEVIRSTLFPTILEENEIRDGGVSNNLFGFFGMYPSSHNHGVFGGKLPFWNLNSSSAWTHFPLPWLWEEE